MKSSTSYAEHATSTIRLKNGSLVPLEVITSFAPTAGGIVRSPADGKLEHASGFRKFSDGTLMDLVRDSSGNLTFLLFQNGAFTLHSKVQDGNLTLVPPQIHRSLTDAVCFPMAIGENHTARELLGQIDDVLCTYTDFNSSDRKLLGYFALYSWLSDLVPVAPYLWVVGPISSGKTTLLRLLSTICRRSVIVGDISEAALYALSTAVQPTLLIDEFEPGSDSKGRNLQRLLRSGSTMGQKVLRASRASDLFGPKVIASRRGPGDAALDSRGFHIIARPSSRALAVLTPNAQAEIELRLQPKLLAFRLNNYIRLLHAEAYPNVDSCLTARVHDMFRALKLPVSGNNELERELLAIVTLHDKQARIDRQSEPEWAVMIALLRYTHLRGPGAPTSVTAGQLAKSVQCVLEQSGESYRLTPKKVGVLLGSLGFRTKALGSLGRGVEISKEFVRSVHETATRHGICTADLLLPDVISDGFFGTCQDCEREGLMTDNEGKKLRYEKFTLGPGSPND
jgi:hypothetical protein